MTAAMIFNHKIVVVSVRVVLILAMLLLVFYSSQLLESAIGHQQTLSLLDSIQKGKNNNYQELLSSAEDLVNTSVLEGEYTRFFSRIASLAYSRQGVSSGISQDELYHHYRSALKYFPYSGELWAKYALLSNQLHGISEQSLAALDNAIRYGRNDYQTIRILSFIAVRDWPKFRCDSKQKMLDIINAALQKNDDILSFWNTENGHMPIGKYVTTVMQAYDFNEEWARTQALVCKQKSA